MILAPHAASRIRNLSLSALHLIAAETGCDVPDILALLNEPRESAQTVPLTPAQSPQAGGGAVASPATPEPLATRPSDALSSVAATREDAETAAPGPEIPQHDVADDADEDDAPATPASSASDITENAAETLQAETDPTTTGSAPNQDRPIPQHAPLSARPVASEPLHTGPDAAGEVNPLASPAPTKQQRVAALHHEHPEYTVRQASEALGLSKGSISGFSSILGIRWAPAKPAQEARPPAPVQPQPSRPETPPVIIPAPTGTLTDRVRYLHQIHPTWTAPMIANELGAKLTSVSTILGLVRGEAKKAEPQFTSKREMLEHYGEVGKRLGKVR